MRQTLYDISEKIDNVSKEILVKIKSLADELGIDYFLVGATVRDMILSYVFSIKIYRMTNDIDFAIRVKNWEDYYALIDAAEKNGFQKDERIMHRYYYNKMIVDFVPFGEISNDGNTITWPDKDKKEMSIIGFDDVYQNTEDLIIQKNPDVIIKSASVIGLVILKLVSWNERTIEMRLKDAKDLYLIIASYLRAGNEERVFDHQDIVDRTTDYELSGAMLLGRDIKASVSDKVYKTLLEILEDSKLQVLSKEMSKYENLHKESDDEKVEWCVEILNDLKWGLNN